ncbi:proline dehydrogenase transcriptional activator [Agrobacterium tumefaciens CCNWGS0286]|jgi:DNA-binding Lrp family transcriptional regulator|uniref:Lrp/AsnC family transcriptional regulator n=1 Tax=Agrobacterium tumefaciens TaxID=358 RepID=UPI000233493C|nr:winged helix-turn-helix transcriptional regulator [Agrobacterium tumefaciens]EHH03614.1 proline dehydrogenase transcriptional activator [Agrobacterium tumefaciens CCNWGS0286]
MVALPKLDRIDINILAQLQQNGRLSNVDLADAVGLSPSPCLARVRRLEEAGYIASYNARLQLSKLVEHITVFTEVTLNDHKREDFIKFESDIRRNEALQECHLVSGGYDYLLKFVIKNVAQYQELMESILDRNIGVEKYFSYIVIKTVFDRGNVPLRSLVSDS